MAVTLPLELEAQRGTAAADRADVPPATLYRQVAALVDGHVLEVADEHRVRGAVERTYRLRAGAAHVDADAAAGMSIEDHRSGFLTFALGLLADFDRYLAHDDVDVARDLVGYRTHAMYLTDEETTALVADLRAVLLPRIEQGPGPGRRRRLFSTVLLPTDPADDTSPRTGQGD